jgi:hypothetical protein
MEKEYNNREKVQGYREKEYDGRGREQGNTSKYVYINNMYVQRG